MWRNRGGRMLLVLAFLGCGSVDTTRQLRIDELWGRFEGECKVNGIADRAVAEANARFGCNHTYNAQYTTCEHYAELTATVEASNARLDVIIAERNALDEGNPPDRVWICANGVASGAYLDNGW